MEIYQLADVFTPCQPACLTYIERPNSKKLLDRAFRIPGKQIIIYGHSKVGKTTILNEKIRKDQLKCIKSQCTIGISINDLIIDAFNSLDVYYTNAKEINESETISGSLKAAYIAIKASLSGKIEKNEKVTSKKAVDLPITPQTLAQFIGASGNCWIIEDFHKMDVNEKTEMSQIMKVFMDQSYKYPNLKIIAIGAVNTAREVVRYDPELRDRITEIEIPLMEVEELKNIIYKGQNLLNIIIDEPIIEQIARHSCGLPIVTHDIAYLLCDVNGVKTTHNSIRKLKIPKQTFESALDEYINQNSDTYKSIYESSTKVLNKRNYDNPLDIINAILDTNKESVTIDEIYGQLKARYPNYRGESLEKHVAELTLPLRNEILRYNKDSMSYFFSNPFIKAYFKCKHSGDEKSLGLNNIQILRELKFTMRELDLARKSFVEDFDFDSIDDNLDF